MKQESQQEVTLTPEQVEEIRRLGRDKIFTPAQLAKKFNIPTGHVNYIINRTDR